MPLAMQAEVDGEDGRVMDKFYITGVGSLPHCQAVSGCSHCGKQPHISKLWAGDRWAEARCRTPRTSTGCARRSRS